MTRSIEELLPPKNEARLRIYAWSTDEIKKFQGCLKVGQTTQEVNVRIKQSQGVAQVPYILEVNESAERLDGTIFRDSAVRERLKQKGFENVELEWMRCKSSDVLTVHHVLKISNLGTSNQPPLRRQQVIIIPSGMIIRKQFQDFSGMQKCVSEKHLRLIILLKS